MARRNVIGQVNPFYQNEFAEWVSLSLVGTE
jgi:hypothetical protein